MKIRKFITATTAAAVLATGVVIAPAASALDLKVEDNHCYLTESYAGEYEDLNNLAAEEMEMVFKQLKKRLDSKRAADIDLILSEDASDSERFAALERVEKAGKKARFTDIEMALIFQIGSLILTDAFELFGDDDFSRDEAADQLPEMKEQRDALKKNQLLLVPGASSKSAIAVTAKSRPTVLAILDNEIKFYESCEAGKSGTFLVEKPKDRDHDRSFERSTAISSY